MEGVQVLNNKFNDMMCSKSNFPLLIFPLLTLCTMQQKVEKHIELDWKVL